MKRTFSQKVRIAFGALFHPKTPLQAKGILIAGLLYGIFPIDLIPDILPLLGMTDDAVALLIAIGVFLRLTKSIRAEMAKNEPIDV
jgi:uncharacterized membrane protein YkvA (DUF1232 family)